MCLFYLFGTLNVLVLEIGHQISHIISSKSHHHSFTFGHEEVDYSSLAGMAGHSHEALEALKDLLGANQHNHEGSKVKIVLKFKLDKHVAEKLDAPAIIRVLVADKQYWGYKSTLPFWCQSIGTPPPQYA